MSLDIVFLRLFRGLLVGPGVSIAALFPGVLLAVVVALWMPPAMAQSDVLIDLDAGRTEGLIFKTAVRQRAILIRPDRPTDIAVLFFRGWPGIAHIDSLADKNRNLIVFVRRNEQRFRDAGLALVIVDCPTDQWGVRGPTPTSCDDDYRSSQVHADDVRKVMAALRQDHGLTKLYLFGHSYGSISSRWLARHLESEIEGSIHSATMTVVSGVRFPTFGSKGGSFPIESLRKPVLHIHHESDGCRSTPYETVKAYAQGNLVSVRGGMPTGDPCGGTHLHSYGGREDVVIAAMIDWIRFRRVTALVGE